MVCDLQGGCTIVSKAYDVVLGDVTDNIKADILSKFPTDTSKTIGLLSEFKGAIELRHELSCYVDVTDGFSNGASFVLIDMGPKDKSGNSKYLWANFDIGLNCREKIMLYTLTKYVCSGYRKI